jgi:hypothetical protein
MAEAQWGEGAPSPSRVSGCVASTGQALVGRKGPTVAASEIIVVNVNDYITSDALLQQGDIAKALRGKLLVQK